MQSLGAFLDEPRVAAEAWVKLSAVYEGLAEKLSECEHKAKRIRIGSNASEFARTVFILESLVKAVCDHIKRWEAKEGEGFESWRSILKLAQEFAKLTMNKVNEKLSENKDGFVRNSGDVAQDVDSDVDEEDPKEPQTTWRRLLCKGKGCVFSRVNPGRPTLAQKATNRLCIWCDPRKLQRAQETPIGRVNINRSLQAFVRKSPDVHQQALQLLAAKGNLCKGKLCEGEGCVFSRANPGIPT